MGCLAEIIAFAQAGIDGTRLACVKEQWACRRFISDYERSFSPDFPYQFNEERAQTFLDWCTKFKHRKGVLRGKPIIPSPVHVFVFGNVYGWEHKETKLRRFTKMYWQVARKNAKSQFLSLVGLFETIYHSAIHQEATEVYCAATKREQAKIVYDEAHEILQSCALDNVKKNTKTAYGKIQYIPTGSFMRALSEEDRKTGDGLNPQCGIVDEYHAHETSELLDVIASGMGAREEPLLAIITTAGYNLQHPCYRVEYDLVGKILNPDNPAQVDHYFAMVNELDRNDTTEAIEIDGRKIAPGDLIDDPEDPATWPKANPVVCSYPAGLAGLAKDLEEAQEAPEKMRDFLIKRVNVWVNQRTAGYMNVARWAACAAPGGVMPDMRGKSCCIGLDLSAKNDLTSVSFEFLDGDNYVIFTHSFTPSDTLEEKIVRDKVPYDMWARDGWLTPTPGPVIDYREAMNYAIETSDRMGWKRGQWCLDMWGATQLASDLVDMGETVVEIIQGIKTLSEPTKDFRNMVLSGRVIHDGSPVTAWAMGNAVVDQVDRNENIILNKKKSTQRIDPVAAIINSHVRACVMEPERELRVLFI